MESYSHKCKDGQSLPPIELVRYKALDNGIRIWMSWCGHEIVYEYEFRGHGDPEYKVDGEYVDWDDLCDTFPVCDDMHEINDAIALASSRFTPDLKTLYGEA